MPAIQNKRVYDFRISNADKLESWDGPVFNDLDGQGDEHDYYASMEEMLDSLLDDLEDGKELSLPAYVFVCNTKSVVRLDIHCVLEWISDEADCEIEFSGVGDLERALDAFNEANSRLETLIPDYTRVVR